MTRIRERLAREEGFTLIELLVVIVIIGILLAIAIPSYLGFKDRANQSAASSDVRSAIPSAEAYYSDHQNYLFTQKADPTAATGFSPAADMVDALRGYDSGLKLNADTGVVGTAGVFRSAAAGAKPERYCLSMTVNGKSSFVVRPAVTPGAAGAAGGEVSNGTCTNAPAGW
jgi:prepilin-type N-terminal cleavage/methylation domain-containing protein